MLLYFIAAVLCVFVNKYMVIYYHTSFLYVLECVSIYYSHLFSVKGYYIKLITIFDTYNTLYLPIWYVYIIKYISTNYDKFRCQYIILILQQLLFLSVKLFVGFTLPLNSSKYVTHKTINFTKISFVNFYLDLIKKKKYINSFLILLCISSICDFFSSKSHYKYINKVVNHISCMCLLWYRTIIL